MHELTAGPGLLRRGWWRLLDGDRPWGSLDIRPDRFGVTHYSLVVLAALVWIVCQIWLSQLTDPWTALVISTALYLGLGLVVTTAAGDPRRQVRTLGVTLMAGHRDPVSSALRDKLEDLGGALLEADESLARGEITVTGHEMTWWRVYDQMDPASAPRHETKRGM